MWWLTRQLTVGSLTTIQCFSGGTHGCSWQSSLTREASQSRRSIFTKASWGSRVSFGSLLSWGTRKSLFSWWTWWSRVATLTIRASFSCWTLGQGQRTEIIKFEKVKNGQRTREEEEEKRKCYEMFNQILFKWGLVNFTWGPTTPGGPGGPILPWKPWRREMQCEAQSRCWDAPSTVIQAGLHRYLTTSPLCPGCPGSPSFPGGPFDKDMSLLASHLEIKLKPLRSATL